MLGFLTRLVERSLGTANVVQPLVASIFAKDKTISEDFSSGLSSNSNNPKIEVEREFDQRTTVENKQLDVHNSLRSPEPEKNRKSEKTRHIEMTESPVDKFKQKREPEQYIPTISTAEGQAQNNFPHSEPESEKASIKQIKKSVRHEDISPIKPLKIIIPKEIETSETPEDITVPKKIDKSSNEEKSSTRSKESLSTDKKIKDSERIFNLLIPTTVKRVIGPEMSSGWKQPSKTPPSIKITIGRIDVRAVTQHSSPRRIEAPKPKLSLDDYLKQRNGVHQ